MNHKKKLFIVFDILLITLLIGLFFIDRKYPYWQDELNERLFKPDTFNLFKAIEENDVPRIKHLIQQKKVAVNEIRRRKKWQRDYPLTHAIEYGSTEPYRQIAGNPPITITYMEEMVKMLLDAGADANEWVGNGETALTMAAAKGTKYIPLRIFELLIASGADVTWEEDYPYETALSYAEKNHDVQLIELLKKAEHQC